MKKENSKASKTPRSKSETDNKSRGRHYGWTLYPDTYPTTSVFNPRGEPNWKAFDQHLQDLVKEEKVSYVVFSTENCPDTGKLHYQGYLQFDQPKSMKQVKEVLDNNTVHLWLPKGTAEQNRNYAMKGVLEGDPSYAGFTGEHGVFGLCAQGPQYFVVNGQWCDFLTH